jgi:hypothetical protein
MFISVIYKHSVLTSEETLRLEEFYILEYNAVESQRTVEFQRTTFRYIPKDRTLHDHHCGNLKTSILRSVTKNSWLVLFREIIVVFILRII